MIPEFPLPPTDADFYRQTLYERPPLFGVLTQSMPNLTMAESTSPVARINSSIGKHLAILAKIYMIIFGFWLNMIFVQTFG